MRKSRREGFENEMSSPGRVREEMFQGYRMPYPYNLIYIKFRRYWIVFKSKRGDCWGGLQQVRGQPVKTETLAIRALI
jgi:hypothetical protein